VVVVVVVLVVVVRVVAWKDTVHRFPIAKTMIWLLLMSCKWGKNQNKTTSTKQSVCGQVFATPIVARPNARQRHQKYCSPSGIHGQQQRVKGQQRTAQALIQLFVTRLYQFKQSFGIQFPIAQGGTRLGKMS
jgi:hypothetical protein